jgi:hypothetical protein
MLAIIFFAAGLVVLVGGVGGTFASSMGFMPEAVADKWPMLQSLGNAAGTGLALLGLALLFKKNKKLDRLVGGNSTSSRIRRTRMMKQAKEEGEGDEPAEKPAKRTTPAPRAAAMASPAAARTSPVPKRGDENATREMRRAGGRISNRKRAPQ